MFTLHRDACLASWLFCFRFHNSSRSTCLRFPISLHSATSRFFFLVQGNEISNCTKLLRGETSWAGFDTLQHFSGSRAFPCLDFLVLKVVFRFLRMGDRDARMLMGFEGFKRWFVEFSSWNVFVYCCARKNAGNFQKNNLCMQQLERPVLSQFMKLSTADKFSLWLQARQKKISLNQNKMLQNWLKATQTYREDDSRSSAFTNHVAVYHVCNKFE